MLYVAANFLYTLIYFNLAGMNFRAKSFFDHLAVFYFRTNIIFAADFFGLETCRPNCYLTWINALCFWVNVDIKTSMIKPIHARWLIPAIE